MKARKATASIHSLANAATLLALACGSLGFTAVNAATFIVFNSADSGPGSLRKAIADAPSGSLITFDASLSGATIYLASELYLSNDLVIDGSTLAAKITISGDTDNNGTGDVPVLFVFNPAIVSLKSVLIKKGASPSSGGGILNSGYLTLADTTVSDSVSAGFGGGIYNASAPINGSIGGSLTLVKSTIAGNSARDGGGIATINGVLSITDSAISGNTAVVTNTGGNGGGIHNASGLVSITTSTISSNTAGGLIGGGGIYSSTTGSVTLTSSTISGNSALTAGGGIKNLGQLRMDTSTLSENAAGIGGALFNNGGLIVTNSTIANNTSKTDGGGIYNFSSGTADVFNTTIVYSDADSDGDGDGAGGGVLNVGLFNMTHSLIAGNAQGVAGGIRVLDDCGFSVVRSFGGNVLGQPFTSCIVISVGGTFAQLNGLNLLGPLRNNGGTTRTVGLLPGSNAIDAVPDGGGKDQRGVIRPKGLSNDAGAYEWAPDTDGDVLPDELDNCTLVANPTQLDANGDGYGNICDPDFNNNGIVDSQDGALLKAAFGSGAFPDRDLNGNGIVDSNDGARLKARFGQAPGPSGLRP